jgi:hypothetical protein
MYRDGGYLARAAEHGASRSVEVRRTLPLARLR